MCVPHRPSTLPVPWEEVLSGGGAGSESGQATPDADEYDMRLGQLQVWQPLQRMVSKDLTGLLCCGAW